MIRYRDIPVRDDARDNRELIRRFFTANPFATQQECCKHTGLNKATVNRHFLALKAEHEARQQEQASA